MRCALVVLALLASAGNGAAQVVSGTLVEAGSRVPLRGGVVTLLGEDSAAVAELRTDSAGAFVFTLPGGGKYRLRAEQAGFRAATSPVLAIGALDTLQVEFSLARDVVVLEPLVVKARSRRLTAAARRFYDRAESGGGGGIFITREEIERTHPGRTTDLLRRVPGVQTTALLGGSRVTVRGGCVPTVYLDGQRVQGLRSIDDLVQPLDVEGIEVYRAAHEAPVEYGGLQAGCAVVLIWTRIE